MSHPATAPVLSAAVAAVAGVGTALIVLSILPRSRRTRPTTQRAVAVGRPTIVGLIAGVGAWVLFGGVLAPIGGAAAGAILARSADRTRDRRHHDQARTAWPDLLDEIRVRSGSGGMALPTACFLAGRSASGPIRAGFERAERTWALTTDFDRSMAALSATAADPTSRLVCSALTVLGSTSGSDLPERLDRLARDRRRDADSHREARARLAGARFARKFVLIVPVGLALAGQSIGAGRAAYETAAGQLGVVVGIAVTALCWTWSGAMLRPAGERVAT